MSGIAERLAEVLLPFVQETCHCRMFSNDGHDKSPPCSTVKNSHRAADALLPVVEREIAAARGEAWEAGAKAGHHSPLTWFALRQVNPYRAALSPDPGRGEGEGK